MAKPTDIPAWATDETNNTEPSAGQKATGWTNSQRGVSSYDNWYKRVVHKWITFFDGLFSSDVDGDHLTLSGDLEANKLYFDSADGELLTIPASAAVSPGAGWTYDQNDLDWEGNGSVLGALHFPVQLPVGANILGIELHGNKQSNGTVSINALLKERGVGANSAISNDYGSATNSANNPGDFDLDLDAGDFPVPITDYCQYVVVVTANTSNAADDINGVTVRWNKPK